jgi:hypothetical protein
MLQLVSARAVTYYMSYCTIQTRDEQALLWKADLFDYRLAMFLVLLVQLNQCEALSNHCNSDLLSHFIISSSHLIGRVVKHHVLSLVDRIEIFMALLSHDPSKQPQPRLYL